MMVTKRDARTGEVIRSGQQYRTYYRGERWECYEIVEPDTGPASGEALTRQYLERHPEHADRVPPIETMP